MRTYYVLLLTCTHEAKVKAKDWALKAKAEDLKTKVKDTEKCP